MLYVGKFFGFYKKIVKFFREENFYFGKFYLYRKKKLDWYWNF